MSGPGGNGASPAAGDWDPDECPRCGRAECVCPGDYEDEDDGFDPSRGAGPQTDRRTAVSNALEEMNKVLREDNERLERRLEKATRLLRLSHANECPTVHEDGTCVGCEVGDFLETA